MVLNHIMSFYTLIYWNMKHALYNSTAWATASTMAIKLNQHLWNCFNKKWTQKWKKTRTVPVCCSRVVSKNVFECFRNRTLLLWNNLSITTCSFGGAGHKLTVDVKLCLYGLLMGLRICYLGHILSHSIHKPQVSDTDRLFMMLLRRTHRQRLKRRY